MAGAWRSVEHLDRNGDAGIDGTSQDVRSPYNKSSIIDKIILVTPYGGAFR